MKSQEWSLDLIRTTRQRMVGQNQFTLKAPSPPPRCPPVRTWGRIGHEQNWNNAIIKRPNSIKSFRWIYDDSGDIYVINSGSQSASRDVNTCDGAFATKKRSISESLVYIGHFVAGCAMMDHVTDRRSRWRLPGMIDQESTHAGKKYLLTIYVGN